MPKFLNLIIIGMCLLIYFVTISAASTEIINNYEGSWSKDLDGTCVSSSISTTLTPTPTPTEAPQLNPTEAPSSGPIPGIVFYDEKTNVIKGEDIQFKLSLENFINKPILHAQITLIPPSGMTVSSSDFSESGNGQYTSKFDLEPGERKDIEVKISTNQVGSFDVKECCDYYFGSNNMNVQGEQSDIPFHVSEPPTPTSTPTPTKTPGFGVIGLISTITAVFLIRRSKV